MIFYVEIFGANRQGRTMGCKSKSVHLVFGMALVSAQAAQAADSVYLGDCTRAKMVMQQTTIDKLIPHGRYEGVQRMVNTNALNQHCLPEEVSVDTLTVKSRDKYAVVLDTTTTVIDYPQIADCEKPTFRYHERYGTVTFTLKMQEINDMCEVYMMATWNEQMVNDKNWSGLFSSRVIGLDGGNFVVVQKALDPLNFLTPIAYTGIE